MGQKEQGTDRPVSAHDLLFCRESPNYKDFGLTRETYLLIVRDPKKNREAVLDILREYKDNFAYEDRLDSVIGPYTEHYPVEPYISCWFSREKLEDMVKLSSSLIEGDMTPENIHAASTLMASYYDYLRKNFEIEVGIIIDTKENTKKYRLKITRLSVETSEPETLEEIEILSEGYGDLGQCHLDAQGRLGELTEKIRKCLRADHFLRSLSFS